MAPTGAKDNHATAHTRSDIGHRPNRGQWAGMNNQWGHFATDGYKPSANSVGRVFSMPTVDELYIISSFELDQAVDGIGTTRLKTGSSLSRLFD
jgi:hypothetical protein